MFAIAAGNSTLETLIIEILPTGIWCTHLHLAVSSERLPSLESACAVGRVRRNEVLIRLVPERRQGSAGFAELRIYGVFFLIHSFVCCSGSYF
jgi:hypothetical protein